MRTSNMQTAAALADKPHVCTSESCPAGDSYFVSAVDGGKHFYMAGPYQTHKEALDKVKPAQEIANKHDGRAWFMSWGTCAVREKTTGIIGVLNRHGLI